MGLRWRRRDFRLKDWPDQGWLGGLDYFRVMVVGLVGFIINRCQTQLCEQEKNRGAFACDAPTHQIAILVISVSKNLPGQGNDAQS